MRGGSIIVPKFGDMTEEVIRELRTGAHFEHVQVRRDQAAIAVAEQGTDRVFFKAGKLRMRVTEEAYHYWGIRLGYKCWRDKQFLHEYERDNPEVRIRSRARATTVRVERKVGQGVGGGGILDQFGRPAVCQQTGGQN